MPVSLSIFAFSSVRLGLDFFASSYSVSDKAKKPLFSWIKSDNYSSSFAFAFHDILAFYLADYVERFQPGPSGELTIITPHLRF